MKKFLLLLPAFFFCFSGLAFAQTEIPLRYVPELPKNLYAAPTAALISYTTNRETTDAEDAVKISEFMTQLLTDNQQLGLQLLHFADKNTLQQPAKKQRLLKQYDSLKIANLLFLDIIDITGQGAQGSYTLTLTAFNKTPNLVSARQKAYTHRSETYGLLIRNLKGQISDYPANYFAKGPDREPAKPNLATEPNPANAAAKPEQPAPVKPLAYPKIRLSPQDEARGNGGPNRNYYYYLGANQQEKNAGFFGQKLRKDLSPSPDAIKELNKFRNYKIAYVAERLVFISAIALYANEVLSGDGYSYFNNRQKVYAGLALGSLLVNVYVVRNTDQHMQRAIKEYNAFAIMENQSGFLKLKPDTWSVGARFNREIIPALTLQWEL